MAERLERAVAALRHRGPNDHGCWNADPGVGIGQTRLAILDLSDAGHQPMVSEDQQVIMAYNGEVYNFAAIRSQLEALGHHFKGSGDSEVILAAFRQWGLAAVDQFLGFFAIALWDRPSRRLTLLRDRLGVKPLYYGWDGGLFWFGSELKVAQELMGSKPAIDRAALAEYFEFGYINAPRTIFQQVHKLAPGHALELAEGAEPVVRRYWSVLDALGAPLQGSEDELLAQFETLMGDAFRLRMVADVPVGVFLSGGVDSSLVTAVLQREVKQPLHTYTIGFDSPQFDESEHARRVAEQLGTRHREFIVAQDAARDVLPRWAQLFDEPFYDPSGVPTYLVSKLASEEVTVVLSADAGDELFSGYNVYGTVLERAARLRRLPGAVRALGAGLLRLLPLEAADRALGRSGAARALRQRVTRRLLRLRDQLGAASDGALYTQAVSVWRPQEVAELIGSYAAVRESPDAYPGGLADQMSLWDLHNYLPGNILTKVDRTTMAASIEGREPLLDHRLVEFALRLPQALRRGSLGPKHLLRKALYKLVPRALIERPKRGFTPPLAAWLRGDLAHLIERYLAPELVARQGLLNPAVVARVVADFRSGDDGALNHVWSLLAFQMWQEKWN